MDSEFLLNSPKIKAEEYGNIKMGTFKEWARLSVLDHDGQKTYNTDKYSDIQKCVRQLKNLLSRPDHKITEKSITKSHAKESLEAMKFLLQQNALKLLEIKGEAADLKDIKAKKPSELVVSLYIPNDCRNTSKRNSDP